ncbi:hypothetical protein [Arcobacter sp. L]|uniref:hypothetical protein n=1 Tax=Arcobacter sp. L TaxID=944547 RepID=UPI000229603F|nr:hypothetical protein [Arcobacter sp. L]BAK74046.1 hypothetical protein ABLL_2171 [Arcobacter sp. L]
MSYEKNIDVISIYGILITVLAFLFVVNYSSDEYDIFDLLISLIGVKFSIECFKKKVLKDEFSIFLGLFILTSSLLTIMLFIISFFKNNYCFFSEICIDKFEMIGIIFCFLLSFILCCKERISS